MTGRKRIPPGGVPCKGRRPLSTGSPGARKKDSRPGVCPSKLFDAALEPQLGAARARFPLGALLLRLR